MSLSESDEPRVTKEWCPAGAYWKITYPAEFGGEVCFQCEHKGKPSVRFQDLMSCHNCDRTWHKECPLRDMDQRELQRRLKETLDGKNSD